MSEFSHKSTMEHMKLTFEDWAFVGLQVLLSACLSLKCFLPRNFRNFVFQNHKIAL